MFNFSSIVWNEKTFCRERDDNHIKEYTERFVRTTGDRLLFQLIDFELIPIGPSFKNVYIHFRVQAYPQWRPYIPLPTIIIYGVDESMFVPSKYRVYTRVFSNLLQVKIRKLFGSDTTASTFSKKIIPNIKKKKKKWYYPLLVKRK